MIKHAAAPSADETALVARAREGDAAAVRLVIRAHNQRLYRIARSIVRDGIIIGRGVTAIGGRPHAETEALAEAGEGARGATAYVTLEPCAHHGRTPPCAEALVRSGVTRVVGAANDPDPRGYYTLEQGNESCTEQSAPRPSGK